MKKMSDNDIYASDPELTKTLEKQLQKTLTNRSISEGLISGAYLTTAYMCADASAKVVEGFQHDQDAMMGRLAVAGFFTAMSTAGAYDSAHAGRNLDAKKFTMGTITIPLVAAWLNTALPNNNEPTEPIDNAAHETTIQLNDGIPTIDIEPE